MVVNDHSIKEILLSICYGDIKEIKLKNLLGTSDHSA